MITKTVTEFTTVHSVRLVGCGHVTFLSAEHINERKRDHKSFYCSTCGRTNHYPGKSDLEKLRGELITVKDQRDTSRRNYRQQQTITRSVERSLTAHKGHTTRLKNRIAAGVCPCCRRNFVNLGRHMSRQHPEFTT